MEKEKKEKKIYKTNFLILTRSVCRKGQKKTPTTLR